MENMEDNPLFNVHLTNPDASSIASSPASSIDGEVCWFPILLSTIREEEHEEMASRSGKRFKDLQH